MRRIALFVLTNIAVLALLSLVMRLLGLDVLLAQRGIDMSALLMIAAVIGFAGSLISLGLSKWTARHLMGVRVIREPATPHQRWLLETVRHHADRAGIVMPEVGIFDAAEMNAFATGARRNYALVAVSSGLLSRMAPEEVEAVLGHEVTHIANGDMVTLALLQGVVNTFVIFLARVLGTLLDGMLGGSRRDRGEPGPFYFLTVIVLQVVLGVLASMIVMWFSRRREFRADAGGAGLAGTGSMIAALQRLEQQRDSELPMQLTAFGIAGRFAEGVERLFMSHPPVAERIAALCRPRKYGHAYQH